MPCLCRSCHIALASDRVNAAMEPPNVRDPAVGDDLVDPDPFAIGFALMGLLFSGGAYLEIRRQRMLTQQQRTGEYRQAWFKSWRTLIHARRVLEEFATYVAEDGYGDQPFLFGKARMNMGRERVDALRRLHGNDQTTASHMADDLDALSEYLDAEYRPQVDAIHEKLTDLQLPHTYDAVLILVRDAVGLYEALVDRIGSREGF